MEAIKLEDNRVYAVKTYSNDNFERRPENIVVQQDPPHRDLVDAIRNSLAQSEPLVRKLKC